LAFCQFTLGDEIMSIVDAFGPNSIVTRFDVDNIKHIEAYLHLQAEGRWPEGFLEMLVSPIYIPSGWHMLLQDKMANAWCVHKLKENAKKNGKVDQQNAKISVSNNG
jgi:hypothetical protein